MPLFGQDPKDQTIEVLQQQVEHLKALLEERDKTILALTSSAAYRLVHQKDTDGPAAEPVRGVLEERLTPFKPDYSVEDMARKFPGTAVFVGDQESDS